MKTDVHHARFLRQMHTNEFWRPLTFQVKGGKILLRASGFIPMNRARFSLQCYLPRGASLVYSVYKEGKVGGEVVAKFPRPFSTNPLRFPLEITVSIDF